MQAALFAAVAVGLRHVAQLERLCSAITLAGVFAASYALVQRFGLDPLSWDATSWGGDPIARTPGTIGNPTFLGGYLAVSICATVPYVRARPWPAAAALIIQGAGIWATGSRGPLMAAAAGRRSAAWWSRSSPSAGIRTSRRGPARVSLRRPTFPRAGRALPFSIPGGPATHR